MNERDAGRMNEVQGQASLAGSVITDAKILAVLDAYHARIAKERRARAENPALMQGAGWRDTLGNL